MIEKLTAKQEKQMYAFREKCLALGLSTKPINKPMVKKYLKRIYKTYLNREIMSAPIVTAVGVGFCVVAVVTQ